MPLYCLREAKGGDIFRKDPGAGGAGATVRGMGLAGPEDGAKKPVSGENSC
jgi:hypothetical protein